MTFFTGYLAQGVGGTGPFVENVASGYARAAATLTPVGSGALVLSGNVTNGSTVLGTQLGLYDAATNGNLIMWWCPKTPAQFSAAASNAENAGSPAISIPGLSGASVSAMTTFPAASVIGVTYDGVSVTSGVALQYANGSLSAAPTTLTSASGSTGSSSASPVVTRLTGSAAISAVSQDVTIRQTIAGTYPLPSAPADGTTISFKDALNNFSTFNATIAAGSGDTIDGAATIVMNGAGGSREAITATYDATNHNWDIY